MKLSYTVRISSSNFRRSPLPNLTLVIYLVRARVSNRVATNGSTRLSTCSEMSSWRHSTKKLQRSTKSHRKKRQPQLLTRFISPLTLIPDRSNVVNFCNRHAKNRKCSRFKTNCCNLLQSRSRRVQISMT